jgi:predicted nucleotidyltransferase
MSAQAQLDRLLRRAADDADVVAVLLFGSAARGEAGAGSDLDVCLVLSDAPRSRPALAAKRIGVPR